MRPRDWITTHRDEWIWFAPVLALVACVLIGLFDFYALPHNDFIQFAKPARWILEWQPFENYKILPTFPLAIALASFFVPGDPTLLHAAQVVNFLASVAFVCFFWRLSVFLLPRTWPLALLWMVVNPYFLEFALQPLMNPFLLAMVTPAILAMARRQDRAFLWSGLAGLGRYDCALLAPAIGICRFLESGRRLRHLVIGALTMVPLLVWMILSALNSRLINPYIEQLVELDQPMAFGPLLLMLVRMLTGQDAGSWSPAQWWDVLLGCLLSAAVGLGLWRLWRRDRWLTLSLGVFIVSYFGMHAVFVAANYRYNYPIIPFLLLLIFLSVEGRCGPTAEGQPAPAAVPLWLVPVAGFAALGLWRFWGNHVWWLWLFTCVYLAGCFLRRPPAWGGGPAARRATVLNLGLAFLMAVSIFLQLGVWQSTHQAMKWRLSEFVAVKQWMDRHAKPGEKILMPEAWYLESRFDSAETRAYILPKDFRSEDILGLVDECKKKRVRYVVWVSSMDGFGRVNWYHQETKAYLVNELGLKAARSWPCFRLVAELAPAPGNRALVYEFRPEEAKLLPRSVIRPNDADRLGNFFWHLVRSGWNESVEGTPENRYLWALGERSTFYLYLDQIAFGGRLRMTAYPLNSLDLPAQRIDFKVNGQPACRLVLEPREKSYTVYLPPSLLRPGENRFDMEYAFARAPFDLGRGNDRRQLSVLFKELAFEPHPVPPGTPPPDLFDGAAMDPNQGTPAECLLLSGWNPGFEGPPGARYVWATSRLISFQLYLKDPRPGGRLELTAYPFKAPARPLQGFLLRVNGRPAGRVQMVGQEHRYALAVPGEILLPGRNLFELEFDFALSPRELGLGPDTRRLSALFKGIRFLSSSDEADAPPPDLDLTRIDPARPWEPQQRFLLREGWAEKPEESGGRKYIRTLGETALLRLSVPAPAGGARLDFTAVPAPGPGPVARSLAVSVNGRFLENVQLSAQEQPYQLEVPPFLLKAGVNRFGFRAGSAANQPGLSPSGARQSMLFREIRLSTISSETGPLPRELDGALVDPELSWPVQARFHLVAGFAPRVEGEPGQQYVWALGRKSLVNLYLQGVGEGGSLECRAYPVQAPGLPPQKITVVWNEATIGTIVLKPEESVYRLEVPPARLVEGANRVEFRYAVSASPREKGLGDDERELAVLFKKIQFVPAAAPVTRMPPGLDATRIDPNLEWAVQKRFLLGSGWSQDPEGMPGKRYVWAVGLSSIVRLYLDERPESARLEFRASPAADPRGRPQRVAVRLNGRVAGQLILAKDEQDYTLPLPRELLAEGRNQIEFKYTYAIVPAKVGGGSDTRQLPVRFRWIRLVADASPDRP